MNKINDSFTCPFCSETFNLNYSTLAENTFDFDSLSYDGYKSKIDSPEKITLSMMKCPGCKATTIQTVGKGEQYKNITTNIYPKSLAKQYPDYIPSQIRQDYEEAYAIVNLSPKASATLSRRCLQGMIRNFFGVKKKTLFDEINAVEDKIAPTEKPVLDSVRKIGNIGAHPEEDINVIVDIEPGEAEKLLKVIEYFMNSWYIKRNEVQQLFEEVNTTNENLQSQRKELK